MLGNLLARKPNPEQAAARGLYEAIVERARDPAFYREGGVPDSLDGRFELILLHAVLVMRRLKAEGAAAAELSQQLFDIMFADMDQNLREMGVGDLSVGKKVKKMVQAFYGRIAAYEAGLAAGEDSLAEALGRNLLGTVESTAAQRAALARYVAASESALAGGDLESLRAGRPGFPGFPPAPEPEA